MPLHPVNRTDRAKKFHATEEPYSDFSHVLSTNMIELARYRLNARPWIIAMEALTYDRPPGLVMLL